MATPPQQAALERFAGTDHVEIQVAPARSGAGTAMLPDFMAGSDGCLVPACPHAPPLLREIWLVFHKDMKASSRS